MIEELRLGDVKEEHILLFPNKPETEYKIEHLADLRYIKKLYFWNPHFERLYHHMDESDPRNIRGKLKENYHVESYQIEVTGGGTCATIWTEHFYSPFRTNRFTVRMNRSPKFM